MSEQNHIERRVFNECAIQIAYFVHKHCQQRDGPDAGVQWGAWTSEWQQGCHLLKSIGLLRECEAHSWYDWTIAQQDVRQHIESLELGPRHNLDDFIGSFISLTSFHGHLSDERAPFEVDGELHPAMWSLVEMGYASREPSGFQWSEKIAPIMIEQVLWTNEGVPFSTQSKDDRQALGEKIWDSLPIWRRYWLAHRIAGMKRSDVHHYILMRWTGETLTHFKIPPPKTSKEWRMIPADLPAATDFVIERLISVRKSWRI